MTQLRRQGGGFTLLEMMLSMAIGTVILLTAASALGSFGDGYERIGGDVAVEREARAVISQLTADLSTARFHRDGLLEKSATVWPSDRIGFFSLQPADAQTDAGRIGDLCTVNYYLKDLTVSGRTVRCLMRGFRESAESFKALGNGSVPALFRPRDRVDEPVAFGVVSFEARPKSRDESGKWVDWIRNDETSPQALAVRLIFARRGFSARLKHPDDWNGKRLLGKPSEAGGNENLEIYEAMIRFGNHESF